MRVKKFEGKEIFRFKFEDTIEIVITRIDFDSQNSKSTFREYYFFPKLHIIEFMGIFSHRYVARAILSCKRILSKRELSASTS